MRLILVDHGADMARAWRRAFEDIPDVEVVEGDYFSRDADGSEKLSWALPART